MYSVVTILGKRKGSSLSLRKGRRRVFRVKLEEKQIKKLLLGKREEERKRTKMDTKGEKGSDVLPHF